MTFDVTAIRRQFPALRAGEIYLDTAATAHKPNAVTDVMKQFYERDNGNVHRGIHAATDRATAAYEHARASVATFLGATHATDIIFTKNATEGINLAAYGLQHLFGPDDTIILSLLEHHGNIVPWMELSKRTGATIARTEHEADGRIKMDSLKDLFDKHAVKLIAVAGQSNVLGIKPDIAAITRLARAHGAHVLIDAAQLAAHHPIDVQELDIDFLAFSGHKLYGPTGIGVLYATEKMQSLLHPMMTGGGTVKAVSMTDVTWADAPHRFEGGTPPIAEAIGLEAALQWLREHRSSGAEHEREIHHYAWEQLRTIDGIRLLGPGPSDDCDSIISFTIDGIHPHDLTDILSNNKIYLRAGHHCAQPIHAHLGVPSSARLSIGIYTTKEEIDACIAGIHDALSILKTA